MTSGALHLSPSHLLISLPRMPFWLPVLCSSCCSSWPLPSSWSQCWTCMPDLAHWQEVAGCKRPSSQGCPWQFPCKTSGRWSHVIKNCLACWDMPSQWEQEDGKSLLGQQCVVCQRPWSARWWRWLCLGPIWVAEFFQSNCVFCHAAGADVVSRDSCRFALCYGSGASCNSGAVVHQ